MTVAIVAGTSSAFSGGMFNNGMSEEQKEKVAEIKTLMEEGNFEAAKELKEELGVKAHGLRCKAKMKHQRCADDPEAAKEALEAKDYSAWEEAVGDDCRITEYITEDNFDEFAAAHELMAEGRELIKQGKDQIKAIMEAAQE